MAGVQWSFERLAKSRFRCIYLFPTAGAWVSLSPRRRRAVSTSSLSGRRNLSHWEGRFSPVEVDVIRQLDVLTGFGQNLSYTALSCAKRAVSNMIGAEFESESQISCAVSATWSNERKVGRFVIQLDRMQVPALFTYDTWGIESDTYVTAWTRQDWE